MKTSNVTDELDLLTMERNLDAAGWAYCGAGVWANPVDACEYNTVTAHAVMQQASTLKPPVPAHLPAGDGWMLLPAGTPLQPGDGFLHPE